MVKKGKSVRIQSEDEVQLIPEDTTSSYPLVPPPTASHLNKKTSSKNDEQPFYSIEMQQEDRFFYSGTEHQQHNKDDPLTTANSSARSSYGYSNNNPYTITANPSHESWSSKATLDPHNGLLQNPFGDEISRQNTLTEEPLTYMDETAKVIQELEDDEERQEEQEESTANNTTASSTPIHSTVDDHGEDESDREFDWDDDPDQVKPKRRKTARERFTAAMKNPCCWHYLSPFIKRLTIALLGSCMFVAVAIVIYFTLPQPTQAQMDDPNFTNVRSNVQCWMYWAAFMWHIFWITTFMMDIVPSVVSLFSKMFHGRRSEKVKSYMEYYMSLKGYFCFVLIAAWNISSWTFLINVPYNSISHHPYSAVITKVFGCFVVAAGLYFIQKTIIQIIAVRFHRTAYKDRIAENKQSLKILDTLSKSEKKSRPGSATPGSSSHNLRKRRSPLHQSNSNWDVSESKHNSASSHDEKENFRRPRPMTLIDEPVGKHASSFTQFKKSLSHIVLAEKPTGATSGRVDKRKMDINSDDYAKKVAKKLFYSLAYPEGYFGQEEDNKKYLDITAFIPYFKDREQAAEAFKVFDKDGNGNLSRREFRDTVVQIYRERKSLAQAIRDTSQALGKIDIILLVISSLLTLVICLSIFSVNFWNALVPFGTLLAACTFIFDTNAKALFTGILFQFSTHPYDAGDLVMIDGNYMTVENIGILGTVFIGGDGTKQYVATAVLLTKIICNVRRSGPMGETIQFNIDFRTDNELILVLREKLLEWVQSQPRDFGPGFDLRVIDILDMNQVILKVWLPHKGNWVELGKRFQRKTRFMLALKSILTELGIKYELPAQRITSGNSNNPFEQSIQASSAKPQNFQEQEDARSRG